MKIGLNAWTVEKTVDMPGMFEAVKNAGFDVLEMNIDKPTRSLHSLSFETTAADYEAVRALSKAHDLPVTSISSSLWDAQMGRKEQWDEAEALLYKQLEAAQELGGTGILICPGGQDDDHSMASTWKNCIDFLKAHRDENERRNIFVGVENIWNCFFLSAYDMASFIDEIGSAKIGAYLDLHIHEVDLVQHLFGTPKAVSTMAISDIMTKGGYDVVSTNYAFEDGKIVYVNCDWTTIKDKFNVRTKRVNFEKGYVYGDRWCKRDALMMVKEDGTMTDYVDKLYASNTYEKEIEYFVECLEKGVPVEFCPPEESYEALRIALAEMESADNGGKLVEL